MPTYSHLHVHTQFSLLDGAADIKKLYKKAINDEMPAMAITDHGNMFGVFNFVAEAYKHRKNPNDPNDKSLKVKPIVGCEFYVVEDRTRKQFTKDQKDKRYHQLLIAKNDIGYKNLSKLCSLGYMEGYYSKWPRIDKSLLLKYHEGLIATSCCLGAMVPQAILKEDEATAEKEFKWWLDLFGEDYYIELQRHNLPEQEKVNKLLLEFAIKYGVKIIASNDSHYVEQQDSNAHDILLCVNTGELQRTPISSDEEDGKGFRFGFPNDQFYFKTQAEMGQLFADLPQAIDNTNEIVSKVELLDLKKDILLPNFQVPSTFKDQDDYLEHITYMGAKERYKELSPEVEERIRFELFTVRTMGFAGYFLIVADFIRAGRDMGVLIGPGRGSAAGSVVAYCIGITNIDPIKYNLLFERFLNPDRKSMPDIDTDFDDEGRQKVIDYVVEKYGKNQVAQIVTYGSMAAKMSLKDVARVLDLPLQEANALAKLVPDRPGTSLDTVINAPIEQLQKDDNYNGDIDNIKELRQIYALKDEAKSKVIKEALILEGSVRGTGVHAAGIIIAPYDLTDILPVAISRDSDLLLTQYEGKVIEDAGMLKMDFLGLKTLTIIKYALKIIKENKQIEIDLDNIPLDDEATFKLYQKGETNGTFQFESSGMQKYLKELKPDKFEDLIAMNALFRPGPLEYIPNFIKRKHGKEAVTYDLDAMEEFLGETYGITVYQEQVMLLSQKLANFTKGDADTLRKAMGKKQKEVLDKMKSKFMDGCKTNGHDLTKAEKVWTDWEAFASYAFNKSHSTCYAFVAYQTAYLKAHYPAEYMAAVLTNANGQINKITFFMEECRKQGIPVLGPDINESQTNFTVNKRGEIRFGFSGIKGLGEAAIDNIVSERKANGPFQDIYEFIQRVNLRTVNKKTLESLVWAGALDTFEAIDRSQYFLANDKNITFIEALIRYGNVCKEATANKTATLFGEMTADQIQQPTIPTGELWPLIYKLKLERETVGIYISGHPLDDFKWEIRTMRLTKIKDIPAFKDKSFKLCGIVTKENHKISQKGTGFGFFTLEDYDSEIEFPLYSNDYLKFKHLLFVGSIVCIEGTYKKGFNSEEYRFFPNQITPLDGMGSRNFKGIKILSNIVDLDDIQVGQLGEFIRDLPTGKQQVETHLYDIQEGLVHVLPLKRKVELEMQACDQLEAMGFAIEIML
ncbi:MAG: DNA polymerase III subunit alpha [Saprospiraceae bacterium]|nr:DNA polymerase III subunit alpha [Saprospiraceae bacterium]